MRWTLVFITAFLFLLFIGVEMQEQYLAKQEDRQAQNSQMVISNLEGRIETLENLQPDIGDYMKQLQVEMAKLWYAEKFQNKGLALYEIKEMQETIGGIGILKPVINQVNAAGVLDALKNTQIAAMQKAIQTGDRKAFDRQYGQTLLTCNECHQAVGNKFIHLVIPASPPVPNQDWKPK